MILWCLQAWGSVNLSDLVPDLPRDFRSFSPLCRSNGTTCGLLAGEDRRWCWGVPSAQKLSACQSSVVPRSPGVVARAFERGSRLDLGRRWNLWR